MGYFEIVAWNSQGSKWPIFRGYILARQAVHGNPVFGVVEEAGRPDWSNMVFNPQIEACYPFNNKVFSEAWVPWRNADAENVNYRCSFGMAWPNAMRGVTGFIYDRWKMDDTSLRPHPYMAFYLEINSYGVRVPVKVCGCHLLSGYDVKAAVELRAVMDRTRQDVDDDTIVIVCGDFNIDRRNNTGPMPDPRWQIIETGQATQQSGGHLDWAVCYASTSLRQTITIKAEAEILSPYKTIANESDHSVMLYKFTIS